MSVNNTAKMVGERQERRVQWLNTTFNDIEYIRSRLEHVISFHSIHFRPNHRHGQTWDEIQKDDAHPYTLSLPHVQLVFNDGVQLFG